MVLRVTQFLAQKTAGSSAISLLLCQCFLNGRTMVGDGSTIAIWASSQERAVSLQNRWPRASEKKEKSGCGVKRMRPNPNSYLLAVQPWAMA
jgi:hypothetical protein